MQDNVAGFEEGKKCGADGGHTAGENGCVFGSVPEAEAVLQYLQIRIVEATVDEPQLLFIVLFAQAVCQFKKALPSSAFLKTKVEV
ncbi:hypothetical protein GCM10028895_35510 [Pontibacter rugosus]